MPKKFHLGWFTNFTVDEWNDPFAAGGGMPWNGRYYVEMAQALALLNDVAGARPEFLRLTGIYHRLVQMWARP